MQEYNSNIVQLIIKSLKGKIQEKDRIVLDSWIEENPRNKKFYERVSSEENFNTKFLLYNSIDVDNALKLNNALIKRKSLKKRFISVLPYAAAVLAILLLLPFVVNEKELPAVKKAKEITAGTSKARLFLADGEVIELGDSESKNILGTDGSVIEVRYKMVEYKASSLNKKQVFNTIKTPRGGEYHLKLSDGTVVWINSNSELRYSVNFIGKERVVEVKGEAFFDVEKNKDKPFIIKTSKGQIKVLGTSFNVRNYEEEQVFTTTLVEGKIELSNKKEKVFLSPGKQAVIEGAHGIDIRDVDTEIYTAWKDGRFVFRRQTLEEIMNTLSRWYDVNVFFEDSESKNVLFSGNLKRYDNFENIIGMVEMMKKVEFRVKENTIWIRKL